MTIETNTPTATTSADLITIAPEVGENIAEIEQAVGEDILEGMVAALLMPAMMKNLSRMRESSKE